MGDSFDIRFYHDPNSGLAHCYTQHNIHERDVIDVLRRSGKRFRNREGTLVAEGQAGNGRYLRVIYGRIPATCSSSRRTI